MTERKHSTTLFTALAAIVAASLGLVPAPSLAEEEASAEEAATSAQSQRPMEEVVVTGTRKVGLIPTKTLSPVDVVSSDAVSEQAAFDLTDGLSRVAPSFNTQRFPIADGTAFIRPVTLRNLSPDHTLVLVNGTRRHRSALVNLQLAPLGTVNQGAQAVDFSTFPAAAIERIEVLRDGASAQYGSDAIAGVVNVILKDDPRGVSAFAQTGEYYEGDGARTTFGGNAGFPLGPDGFLSASFERSTADKTSRGVARPDAEIVADVVGADQVPLGGLGQRWGDPDVEISKVFLNAGIAAGDNVDLYSHGSWAKNETISDFFYREPVLEPVHMFAARATLQQDADEDFLPDPAPQALVDEILAAGLDPSDYLVADGTSPSGYVLRNPIYTMFPGGYNPNFGADITDWAWVGGARGEFGAGVSWDARVRLAKSEVEYVLSESINPSLGALSPTSFKPGMLAQEETSFNADFVKAFEVDGLSAPLNSAVGFEYRDETYVISAGDPASIEAGPTAAIFGVGSDGFQGFPTESAGEFSSESFAGYLDVETSFTERVSGGVALRFEDYDVFGSTFDWKVSGRFDATEKFALRGTANTGFRAPTPGQVNTLNVTTSADSVGNLIPSGVYPVDHPVAVALGAVELEPEESTSFTVGVVTFPVRNVSLTVDYYQIEIKDRLALQNNVIAASDVPLLEAAGVEDADLLVGSLANFFSNAYDSDIQGVDVAVTGRFDMPKGVLTVDVRHNYNEQEVSSVAEGTIDDSRVFDLENQVPKHRTNVTVGYDTQEIFAGHVRASRYGSWESTGGLFSPGDASDASEYGAEILVDVEARARVAQHYEIAVGGENVFDVQPDEEQDEVLQFLGVSRSLTSPFGFNGGHWYARVGVRF